ncbi:MAG TPA: gephyrin-like molybdotransferase Glp [Solirubrobacteraceae bacterium]|nr:gephyrin-like molybdotransferase Glp [Solirubrobacteraceae bacterium]
MASQPLTIAEARRVVLDTVRPLDAVTVEVEHALGSVLASEVRAATDVPPFSSSAMDGYAAETGPAGRTLEVVGESRAGSPSDRAVQPGQAIRVSTGAAIPTATGGVIRQEDVDDLGDAIHTNAPINEGQNIREAGEEMRAATLVLPPGTLLGTAELGAAVSAGAGTVRVARRPRVAVLCTGDELRSPGEPLGPGEIHNSNGPMLRSLAQSAGAIVATCERLPDEPTVTRAALARSLDEVDVLVISGGVSVGPHDHVKPALSALGVQEHFWRVSLQPGGPTWFGSRGDTLVFGLPGNPVSVVVTFTLFARRALGAMQGLSPRPSLDTEGRLAVPVTRNPRREQALRVRVQRSNGTLEVTPNGPQGSHLVTSLVGADALAFIPPGEGELSAGSVVTLEELAD